MGKTSIEWADETWPVTRGCRRTAPKGSTQSGCGDATGGGCYAERQAAMIIRCAKGKPTKYDGLIKLVKRGERTEPRWTGTARFCPEELATPLRQRRPRRIFVSSMSDLFHDDITNEQIAAVFGVMAACPRHTFMVLTKRAARMRAWFEWLEERVEGDAERWSGADCSVDIHTAREHCATLACWGEAVKHLDAHAPDVVRATRAITSDDTPRWPLPNVMLGVSVENRAAALERIPHLQATPAALRFISAEPLLGPLVLDEVALHGRFIECPAENLGDEVDPCEGCPAVPNDGKTGGDYCGAVRGPRIDLVIAGCESGPGARAADVAWYRSLRDQCAAAGVAFFLKQACEEVEICDEGCKRPVRATVEDAQTATYGCGCTEEGAAVGSPIGIQAGPGSHRKPGGVIGAPYLDGVQHLAMPEAPRG